MSENSRIAIWIAIITGFFGLIAAFINNFHNLFHEEKRGLQHEKYLSENTEKNTNHRSQENLKKVEKTDFSNRNNSTHGVVKFDNSTFLFKNRKFIEGEPVIFLEGKVSIKISSSSDYDCRIHISQFFSDKKEVAYHFVKGHPWPVIIGGKEYIVHFVDGKYLEYCVINSYYHGQ